MFILQTTLWGPIIYKLPPFLKFFINYPRIRMEIMQTTPAQYETTPAQCATTPAQMTVPIVHSGMWTSTIRCRVTDSYKMISVGALCQECLAGPWFFNHPPKVPGTAPVTFSLHLLLGRPLGARASSGSQSDNAGSDKSVSESELPLPVLSPRTLPLK